ncbi:MAG TPA: nuclear transport factor 2 family protein [Candidatus Polarisedimenticolia bacterium]|nr:nuclear transport factor 2 family protein [Candidatus Polarisedimenticolia bacterium]
MPENKNLIESFFRAGNRGDLDRCLGLLDEHIKWTNIGSTKYSGTFLGKQALLDDLLGPVFGKLKAGISSTVENVVAEHDFVVVQSRGHAETVDGRQYNNTYCHVFKIRNGKISEVTEYMDTELVSAVLCQ